MTITRNVISFENFQLSLREAFTKSQDTILFKEDWEKAKQIYDRIIQMLERYIPEDSPSANISVYFGGFRDTGSYQLIAEGSVSDLNRPVRNEYNWHLQETSQWLFAFGLVFDKDNREFSIHT